jgi:hypothetical protein
MSLIQLTLEVLRDSVWNAVGILISILQSLSAKQSMPYRLLCNDVQRDGVKARSGLGFGLFCYAPPSMKIGVQSYFQRIGMASEDHI